MFRKNSGRCDAIEMLFTYQFTSPLFLLTCITTISPYLNPFPSYFNLCPYHIYPSPQYETEFGLVNEDLSRQFEDSDIPIAIAL